MKPNYKYDLVDYDYMETIEHFIFTIKLFYLYPVTEVREENCRTWLDMGFEQIEKLRREL